MPRRLQSVLRSEEGEQPAGLSHASGSRVLAAERWGGIVDSVKSRSTHYKFLFDAPGQGFKEWLEDEPEAKVLRGAKERLMRSKPGEALRSPHYPQHARPSWFAAVEIDCGVETAECWIGVGCRRWWLASWQVSHMVLLALTAITRPLSQGDLHWTTLNKDTSNL
ncbi:hypothetical protein GX51_05833 [Blastomyces parvus]|uniref:Uncharacterized protein n=1 Tax=Blastomyces parvus TaxID=2060905 RepID=A0A2B7WUS9_9EURO|nr:hypothetical protein GX51_05833 [Blastomyces parvus]